jgi:hypothetical protein
LLGINAIIVNSSSAQIAGLRLRLLLGVMTILSRR